MGCVYLLTCIPTQKQYIGMTKHTASKRFSQHVYDSKHNRSHRSKLFNAIRVYGRAQFEITILFEHDDVPTLIEREKQEIKSRNTFRNGLNCTEGGEGWGVKEPWNKGGTHSQSTKELLKENRKKINHLCNSIEARMKKSKSMTGKKYSEESKTKRSSVWAVITPDDTILIVTNLKKFCHLRKLPQSALINIANGKLKQTRGYKCYRLVDGPASRRSSSSVPVPPQYLEELLQKFPNYICSRTLESQSIAVSH